MWIIVAPEEAGVQQGGGTHSVRRRNQLLLRWCCYAEENQKGAIQPYRILIRQTSNLLPKLRLLNARDLIYHQSANSTQTIFRSWLDDETKQWRLRWVRGERADRNGFCAIESIILNDYRWTRFTRIVLAPRNRPNLAALH